MHHGAVTMLLPEVSVPLSPVFSEMPAGNKGYNEAPAESGENAPDPEDGIPAGFFPEAYGRIPKAADPECFFTAAFSSRLRMRVSL